MCDDCAALNQEVYDYLHLFEKEQAKNKDLLIALENLLELFSAPGENANETFERIGEAFYSDTHMLRPGKSEPMEFDSDERQALRRETFVAWVDGRMQAARYAIAKAKEVPQ